MKKIVYLAPLALLGIGAKASANQVPTHISNALRIYEQENKQNQPVGQSENKQVKPAFSNNQKQPIERVKETTHISRLDSGLIDKSSSVGNSQANQVMKIGRTTIPTKQELNESKDSVAGQYVQVQQTRVAQFNEGSKIYGLNNSDQLSKNNGDGYVITNAGMYNGRAVDIGVVINNIRDKQGSYTTKWDNGDKADITGEVDNQFSYQNGVLVGIDSQPQFDPNKTRMHTIDFPYKILLHHGSSDDGGIQQEFTDDITNSVISNYEDSSRSSNYPGIDAYKGLDHALRAAVLDDISNRGYYVDYVDLSGHRDGSDISDDPSGLTYISPDEDYLNKCLSHIGPSGTVTALSFRANNNGIDILGADHFADGTILIARGNGKYKITTPVTNALQLDQVNNGSLSYDYTVGVYDAQTGELIKDLTANYKSKAGKAATDQDTVMNDAIKAKIQAINTNQANSAYTGIAANDDIVFNKNTVHVNYVDTRGESIDVPGYDIDVDNLTSGNYQVPQNYVLANTNGFKVTKNTHEVNGVTVTDSYNFIDQGNNKVTDNGRTLIVVLKHGTRHIVDPSQTGLSNDATNNTFVINNGAKKQINSQSRHFGAAGVLDLVTKKITRQGDWQLLGKSNFDQMTINDNLVGYGNAIHNNLTFLTL